VFELAVVGLDGGVGVLLDVVPGRGEEFVEYGGVDRGRVGDHLAGRDLRHPERPSEELPGRVGVTPHADQDVDDLPVLVDGPVDVAPDSVDLPSGPVRSSTNPIIPARTALSSHLHTVHSQPTNTVHGFRLSAGVRML
jgi:hypothetical protein